jgi:hypothetical protein
VDYAALIEQEVGSWAGIDSHPHRFGGMEFRLGKVEIGHVHYGGFTDIPFTRPIRDQLIREGKARAHHILPDSGWISCPVRSDADLERALWLFRLSYLHKGIRRLPALSWDDPAVQAQIKTMALSDELARLLAPRSLR